MMKAFIVDRYGSKDGVRAGDMPEPELREDDVLVQIHAAGVNLLDAKIRDGEFKRFLPYRFPLILGNEVAGVVVRVGSRGQRFKPGDEVYARPDDDRIGAFAECIAIQEDAVAQKPKSLTMEEAASIPLVGLTAWQVLVERAKLSAGQKVLIHAGSGGVGTVAIQLAKHLGAIVATTTSTANLEWVKRLGADLVIDYRKDDFEHILQDYDVVLNSLGTETLEKSLRVLKPGGKLISISGPPVLTTVYNCAQIKLTTPGDGGNLWEMLLSIPTGDGHDQEQDSEYHTRISKPRQVHSRHRDHLGHSQEHGAQIPAPPRTGRHAPSASQSSFQARSV